MTKPVDGEFTRGVVAAALTYAEAEELALGAIHSPDGRGMIGQNREHLHQRIARALMSVRSLPASVGMGERPWGYVWTHLDDGELVVQSGSKLRSDEKIPDGCAPLYLGAQPAQDTLQVQINDEDRSLRELLESANIDLKDGVLTLSFDEDEVAAAAFDEITEGSALSKREARSSSQSSEKET